MSSLVPLVGLRDEYQRLMTSLQERQPLLILGPAGSGKSALISAVLNDLPGTSRVIALAHSPQLHDLLINLSRSLVKIDHRAFRKFAKTNGEPERWLSQQTSVHLRGLLWAALEAEPLAIILDGVSHAGFPTYRFLQRLYFTPGMVLLAAARGQAALGALSRLFWDPRNIIHLRPLNEVESNYVFDLAVRHFNLGNLDVEEFREKVLDAARGNPGQLIEMCRLASNPMYISGTHIKFAPLRIDVLMKFL